MHYQVAKFLLDFNAKHGELVHRNSDGNDRRAVIIETRSDFFLPHVVRNVMHFLGPSWNLHIIHSASNAQYITECFTGWHVTLSRINRPKITGQQYTNLLIDEAFWSLFPEEHLLFFQVDSIMCDHWQDRYMEYDYIGAPCCDWTSPETAALNGGFSYRKRSKMLEAVSAFKGKIETDIEDFFFTQALRRIGAKLPTMREAACFSVESIYIQHPVGMHGSDKYYLSDKDMQKVIEGIRY